VSVNLKQYFNVIKETQKSQCKLLVVSKMRSAEDIALLLENNHKYFGENRVQEAFKKYAGLRKKYDFELHLIGPLQSNKTDIALSLFDCIQSIDRYKIVDSIINFKNKTNKPIQTKRFFLQINIGNEKQKSGVAPSEAVNFFQYCTDKKLNIEGLMCIPPNNENPNKYFQQMNEIKNMINESLQLSMGMSDDYKLAIQQGSNMIRVGSLLFDD